MEHEFQPEVPEREVVHNEDEGDPYDAVFLQKGDITTLPMSTHEKAKARERAKTKRIGFS